MATPFPALAKLDAYAWQPPLPSGARQQQPLPAVAESFLGRMVETYKLVTSVLDRRLVSVTGPSGVGKSAVAIKGLNYLADRQYFSDGVVYVDCSAVHSTEGLDSLLQQKLAPPALAIELASAETPSTPSPTPRATAAALQTQHCLLVLDGVPDDIAQSTTNATTLTGLLNLSRVKTLLTAVHPVGGSLGEKVVAIEPLSPVETARLLVKLSPRPIRLCDLQPPARNTQEFLRRMANLPLVLSLAGNPGAVKATMPQLSRLPHLSLDDVRALSWRPAPSAGPGSQSPIRQTTSAPNLQRM